MRLGRDLMILGPAALVCFYWGSSAIAGGGHGQAADDGHNHGAGPCYEHVDGDTHFFDRQRTLKLGGAFKAKKNPHVESGHTFELAGFPNLLGSHARPTITPYYCGDYVGGGAAFFGREPRRRNEGTWGWDYMGGPLRPSRVFLDWSHGRRYQGGTGRYETDDPFSVLNVLAIKQPRLHRKPPETGEEE